MRRLLLLSALLAGLSPGCAAQFVLTLDSAWEWQGTLDVRCELSQESFRLLLAQNVGAAGGPPPGWPSVGVSLRWLCFGPLLLSGLLREAANPLGFSPGSDVFSQRTGLAIDGSLPAGTTGFLFMPVPQVLGLYSLPLSPGTVQVGCFASFALPWGLGAEGCVSLTNPEAKEIGEEWLSGSAPFPGGPLLNAAARVMLASSSACITATGGASFAQRSLPGIFWHLRGSASVAGIDAAALLGWSSSTYRQPSGRCSDDAAAVAVSLGIARPSGAIHLEYSLRCAHPGFAPRPYLPTKETVKASFERSLVKAGRFSLFFREEARKNVAHDNSGLPEEDASMAGSVRAALYGIEASAGMELDSLGRSDILRSLSREPAGRLPGVSMDARLDISLSELSVVVKGGVERGGDSLSVRAGIERFPLALDAAELLDHVVLEVSWHTRRVSGDGR